MQTDDTFKLGNMRFIAKDELSSQVFESKPTTAIIDGKSIEFNRLTILLHGNAITVSQLMYNVKLGKGQDDDIDWQSFVSQRARMSYIASVPASIYRTVSRSFPKPYHLKKTVFVF